MCTYINHNCTTVMLNIFVPIYTSKRSLRSIYNGMSEGWPGTLGSHCICINSLIWLATMNKCQVDRLEVSTFCVKHLCYIPPYTGQYW